MKEKNLEKDYLSIKEFSEFVGITSASLRHYDKMGVFTPAKHGVEFENKYRFYSAQQITTVKVIRVLTEIGVPLKTIKELTLNRTPEKVLKLLKKHKTRIADEISFLQEVYSVINTFTDLLYEAISVTETDITVTEMPEKRIILGDTNDFTGTTGFHREFIRFCTASHEPKLNMSHPIGGYWESMGAFLDEPSRPMRFFSLNERGYEQKSAGLYLTGYTRGYYGQTNDLPKRMTMYAKKYGLVFDGAVYNIYLSDEISEANPDKYLLQVTASVKEAGIVSSFRPRKYF